MHPDCLIEIRPSRRTARRLKTWSRAIRLLPLLAVGAFVAPPQIVRAQDTDAAADNGVNITYPLPNNTLKGATKVMFNGIPDGGYASIYVDLTPTNKAESFRVATTQTSYELDAGGLTDGKHTLTIVSFSASGRQVGSRSVTFNVVNAGSAGVSEDSVLLVNWTPQDAANTKVQRFRIFAVSDATITGNEASSSGMSASGGMSGPAGSMGSGGATVDPNAPKLTAAPLDHQVDVLVRRVVRDVGMLEGSANIRMVVASAFDRKRLGGSTSGSSGSGGGSESMGGAPSGAAVDNTVYPPGYTGKPYWDPHWHRGLESSQAYTKMIKPDGEEINISHKPSTLPLGDILPTFPNYPVQKGATWNSNMTFIGELTKRAAFNLTGVPMSLTGFENLATPAGFERRCARVEVTQFSLPDDVAKSICTNLQTEAGSSSGASGSGSPGGMSSGGEGGSGMSSGGASGASGAAAAPPKLLNYRATMSRVIWFDIAAHQLVRSEDTVDAYYEQEAPAVSTGMGSSGMSGGYPGGMSGGYPGGMSGGYPGGMSGGYPGGMSGGYPGGMSGGYPGSPQAPAAPVVPPQPLTVTYNMHVIKFLDDSLPNPTGKWTGGLGTARMRDSTRNPTLAKANGPDTNNR